MNLSAHLIGVRKFYLRNLEKRKVHTLAKEEYQYLSVRLSEKIQQQNLPTRLPLQ